VDKKNLVNTNDITSDKELSIPEELRKFNGKIAEVVSSIHGDINSETSKTHENVMTVHCKAIDIIHEQLQRKDLTFEQAMQYLDRIKEHTNAVDQSDIRQYELHKATSHKLLYILAGIAFGSLAAVGGKRVVRKLR